MERARQIAEQGPIGQGDFSQAPLYPYYMAGVFKLFGPGMGTMRLVQLVMGALTCVLVFWIGREVFGTGVGLLSGLMAALCPISIYYDGLLLRASFATQMNLATVACLLAALRYRGVFWWAAGGACFGLSVMVRPNIALFGPMMLLWAVWALKGAPRARAVGRVAGLLVGIAAVFGLLVGRNLVAGGSPLRVSGLGPYVFYVGNAPDTSGVGYVIPPSYESAPKDRLVLAALEAAANDPAGYLRLTGRKLRALVNGYEVPNNMNFYVFREFSWVLKNPLLSFAVLSPLGLLGLALSLRHSRQSLLLALLGAAVILSVMVFYVLSRFRYPLVPVFIILSAYSLWWLWERVRCREFKKAAPAAAAGVLLFVAAVPSPPAAGPVRDADLFNLGVAYREHKQYEQAREYFRQAAVLNPANTRARHNFHFYEGAMYVQREQYGRAAEAFARALKAGTKTKAAQQNYFFCLGVYHLRNARFEAAAEAFRRVLEISPGMPAAVKSLQVCEAQLRNAGLASRKDAFQNK